MWQNLNITLEKSTENEFLFSQIVYDVEGYEVSNLFSHWLITGSNGEQNIECNYLVCKDWAIPLFC